MGILISDSTQIDQLGTQLSGFVISFKGNYSVQKMSTTQFLITGRYYLYLNQQSYNANAMPIISQIEVRVLEDTFPSSPLVSLYNSVKTVFPTAVDC